MWELRFVSVSDDGTHVVVCSPDLDDEEFRLPITDELRDALTPPVRSARPEPLPDQPLSPREIQTRIRGGQSPDELARAAGVPVAKIERFAGPVLSERAHVAREAQGARISWQGGAGEPGGSLGDVVHARLEAEGVAAETVEWDAWRRDDGVWMVQVGYDHADGDHHTAEWSWEPARRQLRPYGAAARALSTTAATPPEPVAEPAAAPGLRMVPTRAAAPTPAAIDVRDTAPLPEPAASSDDQADGVRQRATLPSWDDIVFGVKRTER